MSLAEMMVEYDADISRLAAGVDQAINKTRELPNAAAGASGEFGVHVESMAGKLLSFGSQLGMTVFGLKAVAQGAIGLGQALIGPNASMEQTTVGFETLLGKGQKTQAFLKQLQQFAAVTPFEFPELATDAEHMLAFGFSAKEAIPDLTAIGDAMSAMGKSTVEIDQVVTVFGQMKAAGKVNAGDMLQLTSQGIPAWKMLADAMHLSVSEVQNLSQKGLLPADQSIKFLTKGMEKMFGGGMAAQATTFNGLFSTLQDNVGAAMRAFTGPLFVAAKDGLTKLGNLVSSKAFQDFATQMGTKVGVALGQIGTILQTYVIPAFAKLIEIGQNVVKFFQQNEIAMDGLKAVLVGVGVVISILLVSAFIAWATAAWAAAAATIAATWPILLIGAIVAAVVFGIIQAVKHWADITKWFSDLWRTVSGWIGDRFSWLGGVAHTVTSAIGSFFSGLGDRIQLWLYAWRLAFSLAGAAFSQFGSFIHGIVSGIGDAFSGLGSLVHGVWDGIVGAIRSAINFIIGLINGFIGGIDSIGIDIGPVHIHPNIPQIPYLAKGGYIESTGLAIVHQGEQVVPVARASSGGPAGAGGVIHVHVYMDSRQIAQGVMPAVVNEVRLKLGVRK